jgi:hypothetical protein
MSRKLFTDEQLLFLKNNAGVIHLDNDMRNNAISNLAVAPLIVRSMFVKAGFDSVPAAFSPALYASLILKTAVKTRRRRIY